MTRGWFGRSRDAAIDDGRWVVIDVESSGLDASHDRLLAVGGVALRCHVAGPRICFADSFEAVLRHDDAAPIDRPNILLHGIGAGAQRGGIAPLEALQMLERWVARSPLLAFHSAFDETLIRRAMRSTLRRQLSNPWLDVAGLAHAARPDLAAQSLDDWLQALHVPCTHRHQAAADALATAELMQKLWPAVRAQGVSPTWRGLAKLAAQSRWLPR